MKLIKYAKSLLLSTLILPMQDISHWKLEKYSKIPKNEVVFSEKGMQIIVKKSASPIFYSLNTQLKFTGFKITGEFRGLPHFTAVKQQGTKAYDDYPLRLGLIIPGAKTLTGVKKFFAPEWVTRLYSQIPAELGLDHVHFFNVTQNKDQLGLSRIHPSTELITEEFIHFIEHPGPFNFAYTFKQPINSIGLWISIDGDDTKSDYNVQISHLEFNY